tara:strand:+ start:352 stop:882 length:531 start_codon:yes stop_codon:yes gene_type:complete
MIWGTVSFADQICLTPEGCPIRNGICIGCVEKDLDLASMTYNNGKLINGEYNIRLQVRNDGSIIRWAIPLRMSLRSVSDNSYLIRFSGRGRVGGVDIDCTRPLVKLITLGENNFQIFSKVVETGSCAKIASPDQKVEWKVNKHGLKAIKTYTKEKCIVGPCDWIESKKYSFFYEKL